MTKWQLKDSREYSVSIAKPAIGSSSCFEVYVVCITWGDRATEAFNECILWTFSLCQVISTTNPYHTTWYEYHGIRLSCLYQRHSCSLSQPPNLWSHFNIIRHLSIIFHLLEGQASFSTMEHSGVAHHYLNIQPCHQWYHISMLNFMLLQSKAHTPTPASKPLPNLSQPISTFRPQALVCLTAHTCDRVWYLCSVLSSLTHQVSPFLRHTSGLFEANKNHKGEATCIHFCRWRK